MNKQEYEQKRRESWEEFVRTTDKILTPRDAFLFAFDRAYALGKQTEAITQEEIEKAAEKFADGIRIPASFHGVMVPFIDGLAHDAYLQGAKDCLGKQETKQEIKQETDAEDTVIIGLVARHGNGPNVLGLRIYTVKPKREVLKRWDGHGEKSVLIDHRLFPDLTWDSEPEPVEIIIKRKKK